MEVDVRDEDNETDITAIRFASKPDDGLQAATMVIKCKTHSKFIEIVDNNFKEVSPRKKDIPELIKALNLAVRLGWCV